MKRNAADGLFTKSSNLHVEGRMHEKTRMARRGNGEG
jgi:hypothetical protein